jgi:homocitrate synthase NifV
VFTHESGIHVAGILKSRDCYEGLAPESFGRKHRFVVGKHSGLSGLRHELSHLGLQMTDAELKRLLPSIRSYCETNKRPVPAFTVLRFAASLIDERERRPNPRLPGAKAMFAEAS